MVANSLLSTTRAGARVRVINIGCRSGAQSCSDLRVREMGLRAGAVVEVLSGSDPMICRIGDSCLGLCGAMASQIEVEPATP